MDATMASSLSNGVVTASGVEKVQDLTTHHQSMASLTTSPAVQEPHSSLSQQCCLVENGRRCLKAAGNASYSKRIQKTVTQRKLKLHMDNGAHHIYICDYHKNVIQSLRTAKRRQQTQHRGKVEDNEGIDSAAGDSDADLLMPSRPNVNNNNSHDVDLYQLQVNTLRRYKKHFKVPSRPGLNKAQLAECLMRHFKTIPVSEKEALTFFIYMIKTDRSRLDRDRRPDDVD